MASFEIQGPDGRVYEIDAPDQQAAVAAFHQYVGGRAHIRGEPVPDKSFGQVLKENLFGDDDPTTQNFGEKVGTFLNRAVESMTFGLIGDEASAAIESLIPGVNYKDRLNYYRQQDKLFEQTNPRAAMVADIGGALLPAATGVGAITTLARGGARLGARMGASAAATGAMAGLHGFMEGEGGIENRLGNAGTSAAVGAALGGAVPVAGRAVEGVVNGLKSSRTIRQAAKNAPSSEQLKAAARQAYREIDDANVQITPQAFARLRSHLDRNIGGKGLDNLPGPGSLTPKTARFMQIAKNMQNEMDQHVTDALPFSSLDKLRRHAATAAADTTNRTDAALGSEAIATLDDFVNALKAHDVTAGDFRTIQSLLPKARNLWQRMSKSRLVDEAIEASEDYLSGGASGLRNQFRNILRNKRLSRGFTDAEKAVMRRVSQGTIPEQILHIASGGLGNLATFGAGLSMGGAAGGAAGVGAAYAMRKAAQTVARRHAEKARALIASGALGDIPKLSAARRLMIERALREIAARKPD